MLLELAPVDPRSLMQGDYMRLRYAIGDDEGVKRLGDHVKQGFLVIKKNANKVGEFVRLYAGEPLAENEKRMPFRKAYRWIDINPDSFFFQEGHAKHYEDARYGVFKFDHAGNYLLIGLANEDRKMIVVTTEK